MDQRKALVDALIAPPRNPARMPQSVEDFAADMTVNPLWDVAKGVGAVASGAGLGAPEVGAGIMGAMGLVTPMKAGVLGPRVAQGIRAYHGSPYKFDKFSLDKIGTGEGAQSYGHGLYFAENEAVAKSYRDQLTRADPATIAKDYLGQHGTPEQAAAILKRDLGQLGSYWTPEISKGHAAALRLLESGKPIPGGGHMYEVNINARPEQFLDWDKPLSQQPRDVQNAVQPLLDQQLRSIDKMPWSDLVKRNTKDSILARDVSGGELYRANFGYGSVGNGQPASQLRDAGIPGIRYLDQGSRDAGQGSYNYVVNDDSLIDILKRYGLVAAPTGAMLAQQLQKTEAQ